MAKQPVKAKKKVKRQILDAVAHVHASFNNTIITITDRQGNALAWATAVVDLRARARVRRLRLRLQPRRQVRQLRIMASRISRCASRVRDPDANRQCGRSMR
jgi:hypothetical protein